MRHILISNLGPLLVISLIVGVGYCFGGRIGVGIALVLVLIAQSLS